MRSIVMIPLLLSLGACSAKQVTSSETSDAPVFGPDYDPTLVSVPFLVDDHFIPSGCMGDCAVSVSNDNDCPKRGTDDAQGECHHFTVTADTAVGALGWAGVLWQTTEKNWGSLPGRSIAPGATSLQFYAAGKLGGEQLDILVGGMVPDDGNTACKAADSCASGVCNQGRCTVPHHDTLDVLQSITLTSEFVKIEIPFGDHDYGTEVLSGFGWTAKMPKSASPIEFYVDDLRWE